MLRRTLLVWLALCAACPAPPPPKEATPQAPKSQPAPKPPEAKAERPAPKAPDFRLPKGAEPLSYRAHLDLTPGQESFTGAIDIRLKFSGEPQRVLWLNASQLRVKSASLVRANSAYDAKQPIVPAILDGGENFVGFDFPSAIFPGEATLHIDYEGKLSKQDLAGAFQQEDGGDWYAFTQFEPTDARRAFPCFDEPAYKVPWTLSLSVPKDQRAFANGRQVREEISGDRKRVEFAETPAIPSYLVAFAVGPFEVVEAAKDPRVKTELRIITPRGKAAWGAYAAKHSAEVLAQLEAYFGIPYPFDKLDQIAIPTFFGAMENPGLVTYASNIFLVEPGKESIQYERAFLYTCAHELAHQWFGNLVTMAWWDDTWLNESFAEWMMGRALDTLRPAWSENLRQVGDRNSVMSTDSLTTARAVRQPVTDRDGISQAFDGITYSKGEAVLVMLERHLGSDVFQRGVRRYLKAHERKNATAEDFFAALSQEAGYDVAPIFSDFVDRAGVPALSASLSCPSGGTPSLALSQRRYLPAGSAGDEKLSWRLPVCVRYGDKKNQGRACTLLTASTGTLALPEAKTCPTWVLLNEDSAGYYYATYTPSELKGLSTDGLKALRGPERLGLVNDLNAAVNANQLPIGDAFTLLPALLADKNPAMLRGAVTLVSGASVIVSTGQRSAYESFLRKLFGAEAKRLGLLPKAKEDDEAKLTRQAVVRLVGGKGNEASFGKEAASLARKWVSDRKAVPAESVDLVLSLASHHGDGALFDEFLTAAKAEKERGDRENLLGALGNFRDPALLARAFPLVLSGDFTPLEAVAVLWAATEKQESASLAFDYVTSHFDALVEKLPNDSLFSYGAALVFFGGSFCDAAGRARVNDFFSPRVSKFTGGPQNLAQVLEGIDLCIAFQKAQGTSLESFLKSVKK